MLHSPDELRKFEKPISDWRWPDEPYKGLNFFTRLDAPLFGQRDADIDNCSAIVGSVTNKVLLLHGRSGTGKSSFLRAGLLPRLEEARFGCLATAASALEPLLVRCTADPLSRLHSEILERLSSQSHFEYIEESGHREAIEILNAIAPDVTGHKLTDTLLSALSTLSKHVSEPLVLAIDQGEEIFTTGSPVKTRDAFFRFVEELCIEPFDVKLIISIRTEYYGQFCDQLRIDPNMRISTTRTSLDQYMLHGLREALRRLKRRLFVQPLISVSSPTEFLIRNIDFHLMKMFRNRSRATCFGIRESQALCRLCRLSAETSTERRRRPVSRRTFGFR